MKNFAHLYITLEQETRKQRRVEAVAGYFRLVSEEEGSLACTLLMGVKLKAVVKKEELGLLACNVANINSWMFDECLLHGNNYLDTVSLIIPSSREKESKSLQKVFLLLESMKKMIVDDRHNVILEYWSILSTEEIIVFNQLLGGVFKFKISSSELVEALALWARIEKGIMGIRLSKRMSMKTTLRELRMPVLENERQALPMPFYEYQEWKESLKSTFDPAEFNARWAMDGLEIQVVKVNDEVFVWGRNQQLLFNRFPEVESMFQVLPDGCIVFGTMIGWRGDEADIVKLQQREGKKQVTTKVMSDFPIRFFVSDCKLRKVDAVDNKTIESLTQDIFLKFLDDPSSLVVWNALIDFETWDQLEVLQTKYRLKGSIGLEIFSSNDRKVSSVQSKKYLKKNDSHTLLLVLLYVKLGVYSSDRNGEEYTFGVQHNATWLPIARVSELLVEEDRRFILDFVKHSTIEKFGPVRNIKPALVFEVSFTSIFRNERKKAGVELMNATVISRHNHLSIDDAHQLIDVMNLFSEPRV
jgi:DNA ligase-1